MRGVTMIFMDKVRVTVMRHSGVAAVGSMSVRVSGVLGMRRLAALIPMRLVFVVTMPFVHVVVVAGVRHARMPAACAVLMRVLLVLRMPCVHDRFVLSADWRTASSTMLSLCAPDLSRYRSRSTPISPP